MPKFLLMSDLHNEFERHGPGQPTHEWFTLRSQRNAEVGHPSVGPFLKPYRGEIDAVLLAGDIDVGLNGLAYAAAVRDYLGVPVVYVAGNHEFYGHDFDLPVRLREMADKLNEDNNSGCFVDYLEDDKTTLMIAGQRVHVYGATLWTDFRVNGDEQNDMFTAGQNMNDYRRIAVPPGQRRAIVPAATQNRHIASRSYLDGQLSNRNDDELTIVITHHAPIKEASNPHRYGSHDALRPAYVSDLSAEIQKWHPDLWVWGHTHYAVDSSLGTCKLVSAPRGYVCVEDGADTYQPKVITLGDRHGTKDQSGNDGKPDARVP